MLHSDACKDEKNFFISVRTKKDHSRRCSRENSAPAMPLMDGSAASEELHVLGVLKCPEECPSCMSGGMQGPFRRNDLATEQLHWHCDNRDCRARHDVLSFSGRFALKWDRFRSLTPATFYQLILAYWGPGQLRLQEVCHVTGLQEDQGIRAMRCLREMEAQAARSQKDHLRLQGRIECDATSIRKMYIKNNCPEWSSHIADWRRKHAGESLPQYFIAYVRVGGLIERGGRDGRVLVTPLPVILLSPGARPPTESSLDVSELDLVNSIVNRNSILFGDGARAWKKAAEDAGLPYASVNHSLLEFSRQVHGLNQKPVTAGTQTLDRAWQDLKKYVPSEITAKDPKTKKVNPALWDWIYSWMWRRNCKGDVWAAMPALFH